MSHAVSPGVCSSVGPGPNLERLSAMRRRLPPLAAIPAAVLAAALGASALGAGAATASGNGAAGSEDTRARKQAVQHSIAVLSGELETLTEAEQAAAAQLQDAQQRLGPARAALTAAQEDYEAAKARDAQARRKLLAAETAVRAAQLQILEVTSHIGMHENVVGRVARLAYQQGPLGNWDALLETRTPDDLAQRLAMIDTVGQSENDALSTLRSDRARLAFLEATLEARRADVAKQRAAAKIEVARTKALQLKAAEAASRVAALVQQRSDALTAATQARVDETVRLAKARGESVRLAKQLAARQIDMGAPVLPLRGKLMWPIEGGELASRVGPRVNPFTHNLSCHAGIDISAAEGTPIHAAADGIVLATESTAWDGMTTIIAHGQGLSTWYAHQSRFGVRPGEQVRKGEVIGYVGATGFATGPHLHFNVARGDVAYDPMGWFGGTKRQVASLCHAPYPAPFL